jgi:integrase
MKTITDFMMKLHKDLVAVRGIAETTATQYVRNLYSLNNERPFPNLSWLKNTDSVHLRLSEFAESTQKTLLGCIVSVLSLVKDKPTYKRIYTYWYNEMMERERDKDTTKKTEKQEENWLSWDVIKAHEKRLIDETASFDSLKELTPVQYENLLSLVVLSLYTMFAPRRNQDYQYMLVAKKLTGKEPLDMNYINLDKEEFVFNKYKTAKTYGQQVFAIPEELLKIIKLYLKFNGNNKSKTPYQFLVSYKGEPILAVNAITRILNRIFGKNVGASMLRHIYLSNKYNIDEMTQTADMMGHSLDLQRQYMKSDEVEVTLPTIKNE